MSAYAARWMDPNTGTFLSVDPVVGDALDPQQHNGYAYARNNPISYNDPTGMCVWACGDWYGQLPAGMSPYQATNGGAAVAVWGGNGSGFGSVVGAAGTFGGVGGIGGTPGAQPTDLGTDLSQLGAPFANLAADTASEDSGSGFWRGVGNVLGAIWSLPNTIIGAAYGLAGMAVGAVASAAWAALHVATLRRFGGFSWFGGGLRFADGQVQFTGSVLQRGLAWVFTGGDTGAITLGDVGIYPSNFAPTDVNPSTGQDLGFEEGFHSQQARILGPLYLPANIIGGTLGLIRDGSWHGPSNFMERGPHAVPPRRF